MSSSSSASSRTSSCSPSSGSLASSLDDRLDAVRPRNATAVDAASDRDAVAVAAIAHVSLTAASHQHHHHHHQPPHQQPHQQHPELLLQQHQREQVSLPPYHLPLVPNCASAPYTELTQLTSEEPLVAHADYANRPPNPFTFALTPPPPPTTTPYSPPLPLVFSPSSATVAGPLSFSTDEASKPILAQHPLTTYLSSLQPLEPVVRDRGLLENQLGLSCVFSNEFNSPRIYHCSSHT